MSASVSCRSSWPATCPPPTSRSTCRLYYFRSDTGTEHPASTCLSRSIVPGSQIPFVKGGDRSKATLDIIGELKNTAGQDMAEIRQTVKLAIDDSQQVRRKNIQYTTGFSLPLGKYHLKFVVRENQTGRMGSFETDINLPDLKKFPLKLSSVVLASQRIAAGKKDDDNPLIQRRLHLGAERGSRLPHRSAHVLALRGVRSARRGS